jgi:HB1, ASXL, restriction endonuclease HTH domain
MSALEAAAKVLGEKGEAMSCPDLIDAMSKKGYWTSPNGATPHATLYAAILREINTKGKDARFQKTDRGRFAAK